MKKALIACVDQGVTKEIEAFLRVQCRMPETEIVTVASQSEAKQALAEHFGEIRVAFIGEDLPMDGDEDSTGLVRYIRTNDPRVLLLACQESQALQAAGCQMHWGHDMFQSLTHVVSGRLKMEPKR